MKSRPAAPSKPQQPPAAPPPIGASPPRARKPTKSFKSTEELAHGDYTGVKAGGTYVLRRNDMGKGIAEPCSEVAASCFHGLPAASQAPKEHVKSQPPRGSSTMRSPETLPMGARRRAWNSRPQ